LHRPLVGPTGCAHTAGDGRLLDDLGQALIGQRSRPPASDEYSWIRIELTTIGIDSQAMMIAIGSRNRIVPATSIQACVRGDILL
jgi:hypothetical protein